MHVVKNQYQIPHDWIQSFFDAMRQDLTKNLYENYAEVQEYMYGSAEVVGLMMTKIIGYDGTKE
jgi:phytoene synthase